MSHPINKKYILSFLKANNIAILSTVNEKGLPDAAPIYFIPEDNFDILFISPIKTQKNINLAFQNEVVLTIVNENFLETLQIRGKAYEAKIPLSPLILELANKLNHKSNFSNILPVLKHTDQEKIVIKIKTYEIRMRRYSEKGFEEEKIVLA